MQFRLALALTSFLLAATFLPARQAESPSIPTPFVSLTDPACPTTGSMDPAPVTKELRVLYFPMGQKATIKEPQTLVVHLVFDNGMDPSDIRSLPFARRQDGVWEAIVSFKERGYLYAVYWIEDPINKVVDTNSGNYFEIPFCDVRGRRLEQSVRYEAQSYTGILEAQGIERSANFTKAIYVLEDYIRIPARGQGLIDDLWRYKSILYGDAPDAHRRLLTEMDAFITAHSADGFGLTSTLNFAANQDWIPAGTIDSLVKVIEQKDHQANPRLLLLEIQAERNSDPAKRVGLMQELVTSYPDSPDANAMRWEIFLYLKDLKQREMLYQEIHAKQPEDAYAPLRMAEVYLDANLKLPDVLDLLTESEKLFSGNARNKQAAVFYSPLQVERESQYIAMLRADALTRLGREEEALAILQPKRSQFSRGYSFYVLGNALAATGDSNGAMDAYLEAAVRPSNYQQRANSKLEKLWLQNKRGSKRALQSWLETVAIQKFSQQNYSPHLLAHPAPDFNLETLSGERLTRASLHGKRVILGFWATWCGPCLGELKSFQDFQAHHPELIVLTGVPASTDTKQLHAIIREKKLNTLRIALASTELWDKFGMVGVPNTFVIDENGYVRIQHYGAAADMPRHFEADLKAIEAAGPIKSVSISSTN